MEDRAQDGLFRRAALVLLAPALLALALALVLTSGPAGATITGDAPPASGDWVVDHPTTVVDETVTVRGSVVVRSSLDIDGSTIYIAPLSNGSVGLAVSVPGQLNATDSRFASSTAYGYTFTVLGRMRSSATTFEDCFRGVRIATPDTVLLTDCSILYPLDAALVLEGANGTRVDGLRILALDWRHQVTVSTATEGPGLTRRVPVVAPGVVQVRGGRPSLEDLNVSFMRWVDIAVTLRYSHDPGAFLVELEGPVIEVTGASALNVSGLDLHDALCEFRGQITAVGGAGQGVTAALKVVSQVTVLRAMDSPSIDLADCSLERVGSAQVLSFARSGNFRSLTQSTGVLDPLILGFHVSASLDGVGPHSYSVSLHDMSVSSARLLDAMLRPDLPGNGWPVFGIIVAIDRVSLYRSNGTVSVLFEPAMTCHKTVLATIAMTDCTFMSTLGHLLRAAYLTGTQPLNERYFILNDTIILDRCVIEDSTLLEDALISTGIAGGAGDQPSDLYERTVELRNCTLRRNLGPLLDVWSTMAHVGGLERVVLAGCLLEDNREAVFGGPRPVAFPPWLSFRGWEELAIEGCTFRNNTVEEGIRVDAPGTLAEPSRLRVRGCTFVGNLPPPVMMRPPSLFNVSWGGELLLEDNDVVGSRMLLLNASEDPLYSHYSRLVFRGNRVRGHAGGLVLLSNTDGNHTMLTAVFDNNTFEDSTGPLVDYPRTAYEPRYLSWDARIDILNNTARRCDGAVFWCYGDVHARGNAFGDCTGLSLRLDNLRDNQPVLEDNSFVRCQDCIHVGGKAEFITRVLMFMNDTSLNCTGTALSLFRIEANLTRVNVTGAATAIVAVDSFADAYDSYVAPRSARIVDWGYVRVWFGLQVRVEWANATWVPSGNGVAGAMVTRFDRNGTFRGTDPTDGDGWTGVVWARQWSLEWLVGLLNYTLYTPYNLTASWSSFFSSVELELDRPRTGADAVLLLFGDLRPPLLVVTAPADGARLNTTDVLVEGYGEDAGSGLHEAVVSWAGGPWTPMPLGPAGRFWLTIPDFPEGDVDIVVRLSDRARNDVWWTGSVFVDHTPPALAVLEPANGLLTNTSPVRLVAEFEPGARVWVDLREFPGASGRLETPVTLNEGNNTVVVRASDALGNEARVVLRIVLDSVAPELSVTLPRDGWYTNRTHFTVEGVVHGEDDLTLLLRLEGETGNTTPGSPNPDGSFTWDVWVLRDGTYILEVLATDRAGNSARVVLTVHIDTTVPELGFVWPPDGHVTNARSLAVILMVSDDTEQAFLNGRWVLGRGRVSQTVTLEEGENLLELRAVDRLGNEQTIGITVILDTVAPALTITSPPASPLRTNDPVVRVAGTVDGPHAVLVNGLRVEVDPGTWAFSTDVRLPRDGLHSILLVATDAAGNNMTRLVTVELDTVPAPIFVTFNPPGPAITEGVGHVSVGVGTDATAVRIEVIVSSESRARTYTLQLSGETSWSALVTLERGDNEIVVRVLDVFGNLNVTTPYPIAFQPADGGPTSPAVDPFVISILVIAIGVASLIAALMMRKHMRRRPDRTR